MATGQLGEAKSIERIKKLNFTRFYFPMFLGLAGSKYIQMHSPQRCSLNLLVIHSLDCEKVSLEIKTVLPPSCSSNSISFLSKLPLLQQLSELEVRKVRFFKMCLHGNRIQDLGNPLARAWRLDGHMHSCSAMLLFTEDTQK